MEIGEKFKHKHIAGMNCEITAYTKKGYKVLQTEGKKSIVTYYYFIDFENSTRGLWIKM